MKVLGLDPGSRKLGFALLETTRQGARLCHSGTLAFRAADPLPSRLAAAYEGVRTLLAEYRPDLVALEECFVAQGVKAALVLGEVRGVLMLAAQLEGCALREFAARSVKLSTTGNGGASKEQVQYMVPRLVDDCRKELGPDEADAIALAWCCLESIRLERRLPASGQSGRGA